MENDPFLNAKCERCLNPVEVDKGTFCVCHKYGYSGHEFAVWCSEDCMFESHPDNVDSEE